MIETDLTLRDADERSLSAAPFTPQRGDDRAVFTRHHAIYDRGLPLTVALGVGIVGTALFVLYLALPVDTWNYGFLFQRGFVQWVLLVSFAIGLIHLLRRIPEFQLERKALSDLQAHAAIGSGQTIVQRRWIKVREFASWGVRHDYRLSTQSLAEHDEAELDAAYRLPSDIVQVLPLMGFFGTVFGLSHGLYQSFLAAGGASSKDFAKAIAIAFDNTLLGLALTIILFIVLSLLKKREESLLLQLNLFIDGWLAEHTESLATSPQQISGAIEQLDRNLRLFNAQLEADQNHSAEALNRLAASVGAASDSLTRYGDALKLIEGFATTMEERVKDSAQATEGIAQLGQTMAAVGSEVAIIKTTIGSVQGIATTLDSNISAIRTRIATATGTITDQIDTFQQRLDGVEQSTANLPEAVRTLGDRVATLSTDLGNQTGLIREEIRQPRQIRIVDATEVPPTSGKTPPR